MANVNKNPTALAKARIEAGLTRKQLAEKANISDRTIERWEQRRSSILDASFTSVTAVAKALNCSIENILDSIPEIDVSAKMNHKFIMPQKKPADTNLKILRTQAGLSLMDLSKMTNININTIATYEKKIVHIKDASVGIVYAIAKALNVSIDTIID